MRLVVLSALAFTLGILVTVHMVYPTLSRVSYMFIESDRCTKETFILVDGKWFSAVEQQNHRKPCGTDSYCLYGTCSPDSNQTTIVHMKMLRDQFLNYHLSDPGIGQIMMGAIQKLQYQELRRMKFNEK